MDYPAHEAAHDVILIACYCIIFAFTLYAYLSALLAVIDCIDAVIAYIDALRELSGRIWLYVR